MRKLHGFTLIELLVVIAIIAILAAILFPVFAKARAKSWESTCLSNMKQIALGMLMYTQDYDGRYPMYRYSAPMPSGPNDLYWAYAIDPYIGANVARPMNAKHLSVWKCPGAKVQADDGNEKWYGGAYSHYAASVRLTSPSSGPAKDAEVKYPSQTMLISEGWYITSGGFNRGWYLCWGYQNASNYTRYDHDGRANIGFCDGHVKTGTEGQWRDGTWKMYPDGRS